MLTENNIENATVNQFNEDGLYKVCLITYTNFPHYDILIKYNLIINQQTKEKLIKFKDYFRFLNNRNNRKNNIEFNDNFKYLNNLLYCIIYDNKNKNLTNKSLIQNMFYELFKNESINLKKLGELLDYLVPLNSEQSNEKINVSKLTVIIDRLSKFEFNTINRHIISYNLYKKLKKLLFNSDIKYSDDIKKKFFEIFLKDKINIKILINLLINILSQTPMSDT